MIIGIPKEIKPKEHRVALTPAGARTLTSRGHTVYVQHNAGIGSGFTDESYAKSGAVLVDLAQEVFAQSEMIVKVKEPLPEEYPLIRKNHTLFTYLHLASNKPLTEALMASGCLAIGYESVIEENRTVLLEPMSEIAGKMAPIMGSYFQEKHQGGEGILISGATGVAPAKILILGAGMAGFSSAQVAAGLGAQVNLLDVNLDRLRSIDTLLPPNVTAEYSDSESIQRGIREADIIIGAVYVRNAKTPHLITRTMLSQMKPGAVLVDISIDQGGCFESSKATTHDEPTFMEEEIVHYCVANMPGAYPRTSTLALTHRTLPFIQLLAENPGKPIDTFSDALHRGINIEKGAVCSTEVAQTHNL